ncbi:MAG: sigma-54 dependent transcriptional regulator [Desulfobacterales bacterium]|nr:sigma-54 dependent transcriptional regulator [Desulfobacterales bacterium]
MQQEARIYIVDDDESILKSVCMALKHQYDIRPFTDAKSVLAAMEKEVPEMVLLDIGLPDIHGLKVLELIHHKYPECLVTIITAYEDVETVMGAMKAGADDYIVKPLHINTLEHSIHKSLKTIRLRSEIRELQQQFMSENMPVLIGESRVVRDMLDFVKQVAKSPDISVLISGETGTGKELVAKMIHYHSPKFNQPFVVLNSAAIPADLLESELFGYAAGAFSGAHSGGKKGLIESADGGTLFLDEIGDLPLPSQAKLLRFLENGSFYQVGSTQEKIVNVRVVSASNHRIEDLVEKKLFREDLYYRLKAVKIKVPRLSERQADIPLLAKYFVVQFAEKLGKPIREIHPDALELLCHHPWPGNVRELRNTMDRAVLVATGECIESGDLDISSSALDHPYINMDALPELTAQGLDFKSLQESIEKYYFTKAMEMSHGNESHAARLLGLKHHIFRYSWKRVKRL